MQFFIAIIYTLLDLGLVKYALFVLNGLVTFMCSEEIDQTWNISWPLATKGEIVLQACPGGSGSLGMQQYVYTFAVG